MKTTIAPLMTATEISIIHRALETGFILNFYEKFSIVLPKAIAWNAANQKGPTNVRHFHYRDIKIFLRACELNFYFTQNAIWDEIIHDAEDWIIENAPQEITRWHELKLEGDFFNWTDGMGHEEEVYNARVDISTYVDFPEQQERRWPHTRLVDTNGDVVILYESMPFTDFPHTWE